MSSLIETYLQELDQKLGKHVEPERRDEILRELRSHLWMSRQAAIQELHYSEEEAEKTAIGCVGSSALLAEDLVRRESGVESKAAWRLALLPMCIFALAQVAPWATVFQGLSDYYWIISWISYASLLAFVWAVWRSRRWLVAPMAAVLAFCFIATSLTFILAPQSFFFGVNKDTAMAGYKRQIEEATRDIKTGERAQKGDLAAVQTTAGFDAPRKVKNEHSFSLPFLPFAIPSGSVPWYTRSTFGTAADAEAKWKENGAGYLAQLRDQIRNDKKGQELLSRNGPLKFSDINLSPMVASFTYQLLVLGGVNAGMLALTNRRRRKKADLRLTI